MKRHIPSWKYVLFILFIMIFMISWVYNNIQHELRDCTVWTDRYSLRKLYSKHITLQPPIVYDPHAPVNKTLFRFWCSDNKYEQCGGRNSSKENSDRTMSNLVGWTEEVFSTERGLEYISNNFGDDHPISVAYSSINDKLDIMRADLFRYIVVYMEGGLYLDMKSCVNSTIPDIPDGKSLVVSPWPTTGIDPLLSLVASVPPYNNAFPKGEYVNWMIYARKGSPILWEVISNITDLILRCKFDSTTEDKIKEKSNVLLYESSKLYSLSKYLALDVTFPGMSNAKSIKPTVLATTGPIIYTYSILSYTGEDEYLETDWASNIFSYAGESSDILIGSKPSKTTVHYSELPYNTSITKTS